MKPLTIIEFGERLLKSGDLDPIYLMLNQSTMTFNVKARWCLAYWMFYHAGVASQCAAAGQGQRFWSAVQDALDNKAPRGTERRHFRGQQAQDAVNELREKYEWPEHAALWLMRPEDTEDQGIQQIDPLVDVRVHYRTIMARVQEWRGFGPWIAFKVADMIDAVLWRKIDFSGAIQDFYEAPLQGAVLVHAMYQSRVTWAHENAAEVLEQQWSEVQTDAERWVMAERAVQHILFHLGHLPAPHAKHRPIALQEVETILCKWKSHVRGHYNPGKDTVEVLHALEGYGPLAKQLQNALNVVTRAPMPGRSDHA